MLYEVITIDRMRNVGVISAAEAVNWGFTGPNTLVESLRTVLKDDAVDRNNFV